MKTKVKEILIDINEKNTSGLQNKFSGKALRTCPISTQMH